MSVSPSGEVVEGSSVTLTCSSDANPPVQTYTWYKENITSSTSSGQSYTITNISSEDSGQNYTITNISSEDSGQYWCRTQNDVGDHTSHGVLINVLCKYDKQSVLRLDKFINIIYVLFVIIRFNKSLYLHVLFQMPQESPQCQSVPLVK